MMAEVTEQMVKWGGISVNNIQTEIPFLWRKWKLYTREIMGCLELS